MKKLLFAFTAISAMLLGSCANEIGEKGPNLGGNKLILTFDVEDQNSLSAHTRVDALDDEKTIGSLYLLFFEPTGDRSGRFVDFIEVPEPNGIDNPHELDMTGTQLNVTAAYNILALANVEGTTGARYLNGVTPQNWIRQWASSTEKEVIAAARAWTTEGAIAPSELLMSGITTKAANSLNVDLTLVRNQIRFDVVNNIAGHSLKSVWIYNAYPNAKIWEDGTSAGALDYSDNTSRITKYYSRNATDNEIRGGLYVFPNIVTLPVRNDAFTTCLVVELEGAEGGFFRVNIAAEDQDQTLYRNYAYIVTLNSVGEAGQSSADDAYNYPNDNELDYIINQWDVIGGDVGTSEQNDKSLLSSPYKNINLDLFTGKIRGRENVGNGNSIDITAISSLSVTPDTGLRIISSEFHLNGAEEPYTGITVSLDGHKLVFDPVAVASTSPTPGSLKSGDRVTGTVTLGFMGLRITMNVIQTDLTKAFLNVHLPEGGIPAFAPFAGIESGKIRVEASGEWSARIVSEDGGFEFAAPYDGTTISWQPLSVKEFSIRTSSANPSANLTREAYIIVNLKEDPNNYSRHIHLTQQQKTEIAISPRQTVTFDGMGALAAIPNNLVDTFSVLPGTSGEGATATQNEWTYRVEARNAEGEYEVVYIEDGVGNSPQGVQNAGLDWFEVSAVHPADPANLSAPNSFTVNAKDKNTSGKTRQARVVVYLKSTGPAGTMASIDVVQQSSIVTLSPNSVPAIAKIGGTSQAIGIQTDKTSKWEVLGITTKSGTNNRNKTLVNHEAELIVVDLAGNTVTEVPAGGYSVENHRFKVKFPKIYYPNREIPISAEVRIGIVDSDLEATITVNQTTLTPAPMNAWGLNGSPNYNMGSTYSRGWEGTSGSNGLQQIPGYRYLGSSVAATTTSVNASATYLQLQPHISGSAGSAYLWNMFNEFVTQRDITNNDNNGLTAINNTAANNPMRKGGYPNSVSGGDRNGMIDKRRADTKLFQFLFEKGNTPLDPKFADGNTYFYVDNINTHISGTLPETAIPLISKHSEASNSSGISTDALLIIDVENKFMWCGELQMFWYDTWLTDSRGTFLDNLMHFIGNAAKYGSHFTDMFLEKNVPSEKQIPSVDGGRYMQPAPWDDHWGANKGVTK